MRRGGEGGHPVMADTFELKLLTPQREVFDEPVEQVTAQGALGQFGVLPDHVAFLTSLDPGPLTIRTAGGRDRKSTRLNSSHYQPSRMPSSA